MINIAEETCTIASAYRDGDVIKGHVESSAGRVFVYNLPNRFFRKGEEVVCNVRMSKQGNAYATFVRFPDDDAQTTEPAAATPTAVSNNSATTATPTAVPNDSPLSTTPTVANNSDTTSETNAADTASTVNALVEPNAADTPNTTDSANTSDTTNEQNTAAEGSATECINNSEDKYAEYKTVSEINDLISKKLWGITEFRSILVKGEVTNFNGQPEDKACFFTIKDEDSLLNCVVYARDVKRVINFELANGKKVAIKGSVSYYSKNCGFRIAVTSLFDMEEDGEYKLKLAALEEKLRLEGIFDIKKESDIPKYQKAIGIVTSKDGEAIGDILSKAKERNPYVKLYLFASIVQGIYAVDSVCDGIKQLDSMGLDVIIVARGGGSDEELLVFNDEKIVRAIAEARTPIITGLGHSGDYTLAEKAASKRYELPLHAAEVIFDVMSEIRRIDELQNGINKSIKSIVALKKSNLSTYVTGLHGNTPLNRIRRFRDRLETINTKLAGNANMTFERKQNMLRTLKMNIEANSPVNRLEKQNLQLKAIREKLKSNSPEKLISNYRDRIPVVQDKLNYSINRVYNSKHYKYEVLVSKLNGLSPTAKLVNGFGYISSNNNPVTSVESVSVGDEISVRISDGEIGTKVVSVNKEADK